MILPSLVHLWQGREGEVFLHLHYNTSSHALYIQRPNRQPRLVLMKEIYCCADDKDMDKQTQNRTDKMKKEVHAYLLQA